jgi:hypothetical protein
MRVRTMAIVAACLGVLGVSGCGNSVQSCGAEVYGPVGQHGFAKPRQVLRFVLAADPWLSQDGWAAASRAARALEFRSGSDSVDIVKRSDGKWVVGAVTACQ